MKKSDIPAVDFVEMGINLINRWVLSPCDAYLPEIVSKKYGAPPYFIGFVYVDHQCGMTILVVTCCDFDSAGNIILKRGPREDNEGLRIRFNPAENYAFRILRPIEVSKLHLPDSPKGMELYKVANLEEVRKMTSLHRFRHPAFPDDVNIILWKEGLGPEQVWARIELLRADGVLECTLLNQPNQDFNLNKGARIKVAERTNDGEPFLICIGWSY